MNESDRKEAARLAENLKAMYAFPDVVLFLERLAAEPDQHPDDAAVNDFAAAMKAKLASKRAQGRGGWDDKATCTA